MTKWIDLKDPSKPTLQAAAADYGLSPILVEDLLDPNHLPKALVPGTGEGDLFLILRVLDPQRKAGADTIRRMTRKLSVCRKGDLVLTVHRADLPFVNEIRAAHEAGEGFTPDQLISQLVRAAIDCYVPMIEETERMLEKCESALLRAKSPHRLVTEIHLLRRRIMTVRRVLWHTQSAFQKLPGCEDLREDLQKVLTYSDELYDESTALMNLGISFQDYRTNEVMRVLTVMSAFFLPLTFIVGLYGMNFVNMPEIHWHYGYAYCWVVMGLTTLGITAWFAKKGWLDDGRS